jgi:Mg2+-importing ATPase
MSHAVAHADVPVALTAAGTAPVDTVLRQFDSRMEGLAEERAEQYLQQYGGNAIAMELHGGVLRELWQRARNPLNFLLIALALLSLAIGDPRAALIILLMIVLSVSLAFVQEHRANRAADRLKAMVHTTATVARVDAGGRTQLREVPIQHLVPGDIVHLAAGDMIPADLRLLTAKDLFVNQAALTGESLPVEKFADPADAQADSPSKLTSICFLGTHVISGTATALVVATGAGTCFGTIADSILTEREHTSFELGINRFSLLMLRFVVVMAPLVFLINGLTKGSWLEALLFACAVAVGLTPEMLPMIVTVNLGKGALALSRKQVIVKRLDAIQNFGAMDILCTDKTGTLTQDRIILERHVDLSGQESQQVLDFAFLNSFYQTGLKNLLDVAVLQYTEIHEKLQPNAYFRKIDELPFDFERRRMSVVVEGRGRRLLICKGAVEEVFAVSREGEQGGERFALDSGHLAQLQAVSDTLNEDGFRVIAIAYKEVSEEQSVFELQDESDLILVGYIAFLDPPKESASAAIKNLERHGVRTRILTGDNEVISKKICREVGIPVDHVMIGSEVDRLDDAQLGERAEYTQVFARLTPHQKARIIDVLRARGHVVGFLGDGINDGPALKAADVGISVDTAVDIAKESADIILLEKNLQVLGAGVTEGRNVFGNIVKYIRMGASSNFGNMLSVLGASAWLPFLPMAPIQVLTNNLLYDFSQAAIPTDHVDREYLARPRRWEVQNIARFIFFLGPISSVFDYITYAVMYYGFGANTPQHAALFQTGWFVESLLSQTLIIHVIRTQRLPLLQSRASRSLTLMTALICAIAITLPYSPLAPSLGMVALPAAYWPFVIVLLLTYMALALVLKQWFQRRYGLG